MSNAKIIVVLLAGLVVGFLATRGVDETRAQAPAGTAGGIQSVAVGTPATVHLRGDASGIAFGDRVPAIGHLITRSGKIAAADDHWVLLDAPDGRYAFPREAIAAIHLTPAGQGKK